MGLFGKIFNKIKQASRPKFQINKDTKSLQFLLNTSSEKYFTLEFEDIIIKDNSNSKTKQANSILVSSKSLGRLHIESIELDFDYEYNSSISSIFELMLKKQLQKYKVAYISSYEEDNYKLTKYRIDQENEIGLIWFKLGSIDIFIVDKNGYLFNNLCKYYDLDDEMLPIRNFELFDFEITSNLLKEDIEKNFIDKH